MSRTTDMILELSRSNITPDSNFAIKYGNGSLNVNLALLLPCSDSDFKRLTAFIDKIDVFSDMEAAAGFIWRYVFAMNTELNRIKESYPDGDTKSRAECQKLINRFEKYMQVLTDKYSYMLPEAETEKTPEKRQRAKSADIYVLSGNARRPEFEIKVYPGKIVTAPDGIQYGIYKYYKGDYKIIDLYTGVSIGSGHSAAECKEVLTAELCARVAECRTKDKYKIYLSNFAAAMTAAGYSDYIIPYSAADPEPAPAPAAEQDNTPAEAEQVEPAEQAEPYNIDYDALLLRFGERYAQLYDMNGAEYGWQTYRDALNMFENGMDARDIATLRKFVELRHDYVSSDREAAAFMLALVDVLNAPETPETAPEPDNSILPAETETAPEPTTGAGTPAGIAGTPADTTGGAPAGMQAETTGGTAGTQETTTTATAAGIAPAHYITAALYPDPAIIAGIPPALYNLPRRNKTASALLYSIPAFMRHRRHAARIKAIYRAPPALKRLRQRIRGMIDSEKPPARYYRISARRQNNQIYISWRRSIIRQNMRGYIDDMAPKCRTPERQQAIKRARTRQNDAGRARQCRNTSAAERRENGAARRLKRHDISGAL